MTAGAVVVGAGIAGLLAARRLQAAGLEVVVLDKGRKPGGRMATRHAQGAVFDHGAQFLTTKNPRFRAVVEELRDRGRVATWFRGSPDADAAGANGHPRFRGAPYQRAICEELARDVDVRLDVRVASITAAPRHTTPGHTTPSGGVPTRTAPGRPGWRVLTDAGERWDAAAVVVTPPAPQALALVADVALPASLRSALASVDYDPCLAAMAALDAPSAFGNVGALRLDGEPLSWLGDNHAKGISDVAALTLHAGPETSRAWWDHDDQDIGQRLLIAARPWIGDVGARVVAVQRWRYSRPRGGAAPDGATLATDEPAPLAFAGDGLAGGRVEGAAVSGLEAADALLEMLAA